ncbi:hypothetical protein KSX_75090 [Ktedonospora formicarum]|uniref:Uncharacterized protein n=1 Tax=Ktedonospora formicarum TaxID=2778364 RepID=A0A8J3MWU5_9CHLR|nr:hypothetical protein KSX_75090 [Ktedonospora formicarum]
MGPLLHIGEAFLPQRTTYKDLTNEYNGLLRRRRYCDVVMPGLLITNAHCC